MSAEGRRYDEWERTVAGNWTDGSPPALKLASYDAWAEGTFGIEPPQRADVAATAVWLQERYELAQQRLKERHDDSDRNRTVHA